ncbi:hypothetical protein [Ruegeria arenilitoris]|uniref:hypothetical protein n=1 Tax=Ruegeria arenilitoris TaxID=1173585 RepID=UPI00147DCE80|nr:hypothetical protein [Ruegeria arenilitoris]
MQLERPPLTTLAEFHEVIKACEAGEHIPATQNMPEHYRTPEGRLIAAVRYRDAIKNLEQMEIIEQPLTVPVYSTWQEAQEIVSECPAEPIRTYKGTSYYLTDAGVKYDFDTIEYMKSEIIQKSTLEKALAMMKAEYSAPGSDMNQKKAVAWKEAAGRIILEIMDDYPDHRSMIKDAFIQYCAWQAEEPDLRREIEETYFRKIFSRPAVQQLIEAQAKKQP